MLKDKTIQIRLAWNGKTFSLSIPKYENLQYLKKFIVFTFADDLKDIKWNNLKVIYLGKYLTDDSLIVCDLIDSNPNPQFFISFKFEGESKYKSLLSNFESKPKATLFQMKEFKEAETSAIEEYIRNMTIDNKLYSNFIPLFHSTVKSRTASVLVNNEKSIMENHIIEHYPIRNFFQFGLIFNFFFIYLFFAGTMKKEWAYLAFVCSLVVYYWYYVISDINTFYNKKIHDLRFDDKDGSILDTLDFIKKLEDGENENSEEESDDGKIAKRESVSDIHQAKCKDEKVKTKSKSKGNVTIIEPEETKKEIENIDNIDDIVIEDDTNKDRKEDKEMQLEKVVSNTNIEMSNKQNKIKDDNKSKEIKTEKPSGTDEQNEITATNKDEEENESRIAYILRSIGMVLFTFAISIIPPLCDAFELANPFIIPPQKQQEQIININVEIKAENINEEAKQNSSDEGKREITSVENEPNKRSINTDLEGTLNNDLKVKNDKLTENKKYDVDSQSLLKKFNILTDDVKAKTEGEFIFSENALIETLSNHNISLQEQLKKVQQEQIVEDQKPIEDQE